MSFRTTLVVAVGLCLGLSQSASADPIGQLGVLDSSTGLAPGDQYRLVFVTSTAIPRGAANSTNIADYDALVQGYANTAGYGSVTWSVIGSTAAVDAIDHTGTNPATNGAGVPIYLFDGMTLFAADNTDLWNGSALISAGVYQGINIDENGNATTLGRAWTGTLGLGGTEVQPGGTNPGALGATDGTVTVGNAAPANNFNWGNVFQYDPDTFDAGLYGISEVLTVPVPKLSAPFAITNIQYDPDADQVTLTWRNSGAATYIVKYSTDLIGWGGDMGGGLLPDEGETTTKTFDLTAFGIEGETELFFRIEEE